MKAIWAVSFGPEDGIRSGWCQVANTYKDGSRLMDKTFVEMKLFQVKPDKLELFETKVEAMFDLSLPEDLADFVEFTRYG